jgi:hypothetical protein
MKKILTCAFVIAAGCAGIAAQAADSASTAPATPALTKQEAKDMKTQSDGAYKARKNVAEANHDLNKADCEVSANGNTERACKKDARSVKKHEKAEAKAIHESEKDAIKANSK